MDDDFYATIKLKTGEEIFGRILPNIEQNATLIIINNPIVVSKFKTRSGEGYRVEPWLKTTTEDLFVINLNDIITMTETKDIQFIMMHQEFIKKTNTGFSPKNDASRRMGYISNVNDAKRLLENIYKNS